MDVWDEFSYRKRVGAEPLDPVATTGDREWRVLRGGGWDDPADYLQTAYRARNPAKNLSQIFGFRVAVVPAGLGS